MSQRKNLITRYLHGLNISVRGNAQAFGYSITITAVYGTVAASHSSPSGLEILGFAVFGVAGFSILNLVISALVKDAPDRAEKTTVLLRATATDFLAVGAAVGSAVLLTQLVSSWVIWPLASGVAGIVYVLVQALEISVGRAEDADDNADDESG